MQGVEVNPAEGWPEVREAQAQMVNVLPNVGLALAIDIGNSKDIHPRNKAEVGRRLALAAEKIAYGQDVIYSGPTFKFMQTGGGKLVLFFDHAEGGLVCKGDTLTGFEIAGQDGKYLPATATIDGDKVILISDKGISPKSVRYGWSDDPKCNLYNKSDLPTVPFRTEISLNHDRLRFRVLLDRQSSEAVNYLSETGVGLVAVAAVPGCVTAATASLRAGSPSDAETISFSSLVCSFIDPVAGLAASSRPM